jgi:hypothetical protein
MTQRKCQTRSQEGFATFILSALGTLPSPKFRLACLRIQDHVGLASGSSGKHLPGKHKALSSTPVPKKKRDNMEHRKTIPTELSIC